MIIKGDEMTANFCVFLHIRYMNPKVMGIAHDYFTDNQLAKNPKGNMDELF